LAADGSCGDIANHRTKDDAVKRHDCVPVRVACQAAWIERRSLTQNCSPLAVLLDCEFKPREARELHLRPQAQQVFGDKLLHSPEVDGFADHQVVRVPTPATQTNAADCPIHPAAKLPGERERVPTIAPADALNN